MDVKNMWKFVLFVDIIAILWCGGNVAGFDQCTLGVPEEKRKALETFYLKRTRNPCFTCQCRYEGASKICKIVRKKCPKLSCSMQVVKPGSCCRQCKGCFFNGHSYKNQEKWKDPSNNCTTYQCNEGVVSKISPQCVSKCSNPINVPGSCCPKCKGCQHNGKTIAEGETVKDGACSACTCRNGSITCTRKMCPHLPCVDAVLEYGKCCPTCNRLILPTKVNWNERTCYVKGKRLTDGQVHKLDKCTTCNCKNGTAACFKEECKHDQSCDVKDLVDSSKHCCPVCAGKLTCKYNGKKYSNRELWYLPGCVMCYCRDGHTICKKQTCKKELKCKAGYFASYKPGSCCKECMPEKQKCIGFGDPHYRTFDGKAFSYQGVCKYTLTKDCTKQKLFHVIARNHARYTRQFSWIKTVTFVYRNITISLQQNYRVKVNGKKVRMPFLYYPYIDIRRSKRYVYVYTKDGITIKWDGDSYIETSLPEEFKEKVCGLCGNYNDTPEDDFQLPNDVIALTPEQFGDYWKLKGSKICKRHAKTARNIPRLSQCFGWKLYHAHHVCKKAFSDSSISACKWHASSVSYFQDCVTDVCQCPTGKQHCECGAIRSYYEKCSRVVKNLVWKRKDKCDVSCTGGSIYSSCGPGCKQTCDSINRIEPCNKPCVPGCHCPAGFVWHGDKCILAFDCPYKKKR